MRASSSSTGQAFASSEWLANHYMMKLPSITRNMLSLPIHPGDRVLDLGCAIGFHMEYLLRLVGPEGRVVGIDHDPDLLSVAEKRLGASMFENWHLENTTIEEALESAGEYDKIILFNCLSYYRNPEDILCKLYSKMRNGSTLIVKDFDATTSTFSPSDEHLHGVFRKQLRVTIENSADIYLNKFVGCSLHRITSEFSQNRCRHLVWPYIFHYPFSEYSIAFMRNVFQNSLNIVKNDCDRNVLNYIYEYFVSAEAGFYKNRGAVFVENEHLIIMRA